MYIDRFKEFVKDQLELLGRSDVMMLELDQLNIGSDVGQSLMVQASARRKRLSRYLLQRYQLDHEGADQPKSLEFVEQSSYDPPEIWDESRDLLVIIEWGTPDGDQSRFYVHVPDTVGTCLRLPRCLRSATKT